MSPQPPAQPAKTTRRRQHSGFKWIYRAQGGQRLLDKLFHHTKAEWHDRRARIEAIYVDQSRSLKDLTATMRKEGFKASESQFRLRLKQWGCKKYVKLTDEQMAYIALKVLECSREGRQGTSIRLNGEKVPSVGLVRTLRRRVGSQQFDFSSAQSILSRPSISAYTSSTLGFRASLNSKKVPPSLVFSRRGTETKAPTIREVTSHVADANQITDDNNTTPQGKVTRRLELRELSLARVQNWLISEAEPQSCDHEYPAGDKPNQGYIPEGYGQARESRDNDSDSDHESDDPDAIMPSDGISFSSRSDFDMEESSHQRSLGYFAFGDNTGFDPSVTHEIDSIMSELSFLEKLFHRHRRYWQYADNVKLTLSVIECGDCPGDLWAIDMSDIRNSLEQFETKHLCSSSHKMRVLRRLSGDVPEEKMFDSEEIFAGAVAEGELAAIQDVLKTLLPSGADLEDLFPSVADSEQGNTDNDVEMDDDTPRNGILLPGPDTVLSPEVATHAVGDLGIEDIQMEDILTDCLSSNPLVFPSNSSSLLCIEDIVDENLWSSLSVIKE